MADLSFCDYCSFTDQCNMVEGDQLNTSYIQLQISFEQLKTSHSNLTVEKKLLVMNFTQLQIRYKNLTEDPAVKRILCGQWNITVFHLIPSSSCH